MRNPKSYLHRLTKKLDVWTKFLTSFLGLVKAAKLLIVALLTAISFVASTLMPAVEPVTTKTQRYLNMYMDVTDSLGSSFPDGIAFEEALQGIGRETLMVVRARNTIFSGYCISGTLKPVVSPARIRQDISAEVFDGIVSKLLPSVSGLGSVVIEGLQHAVQHVQKGQPFALSIIVSDLENQGKLSDGGGLQASIRYLKGLKLSTFTKNRMIFFTTPMAVEELRKNGFALSFGLQPNDVRNALDEIRRRL
jgi:hypothetical protein